MVHFHSSDDRFCGSRSQPREFSLDPNEVTCRACQDGDRLTLSPQGLEYVRSIDPAA